MADIAYEKKNRCPHGTPRNPARLYEIARLREVEKLQWREIGPLVGVSAQAACMLYNLWRDRGWFNESIAS